MGKGLLNKIENLELWLEDQTEFHISLPMTPEPLDSQAHNTTSMIQLRSTSQLVLLKDTSSSKLETMCSSLVEQIEEELELLLTELDIKVLLILLPLRILPETLSTQELIIVSVSDKEINQ